LKNIIHFSGDDYWNSNPHSRFHIINSAWEQGYKILWINPLGTRFPSLRKKGFSSRIWRKLKSLIKFVKLEKPNYYVYTPFYLPIFSEGFTQRINFIFLSFQIDLLQKILGFVNPILFFSTLVYGELIKKIKHKYAVFYYSDNYILYRELTAKTKEYLSAQENYLLDNSDLILCASQAILNYASSRTRKTIRLFPHQVDFNYFNSSLRHSSPLPIELSQIHGPIVGYYGTLTDSNDWELIEYCANLRPHYNFVFIGRKDISNSKIEQYSNIIFIGKKDYKALPYYARHFNVCIMFWIRRDWIKNSSPLKLKEYLSMEKPVVSTYIEEIARLYSDIVYIAKSKEEFLLMLDEAISRPDQKKILKGLAIVKNDSWLNAVRTIESYI